MFVFFSEKKKKNKETENRVARVKDIAEHLDVRMSSVTSALKNLSDRNLIAHEKEIKESCVHCRLEFKQL